MGNDQLLPAYNMQIAVADEYIAAIDTQQYASDMDCFIPLMEKFRAAYGFYPRYPVADAGYGSYNNYLYCEEHGMEKFMKFTMYEKTVKDESYRTIQAEGTFGIVKWDRHYKRLARRGMNAVKLEFAMIAIGFNLYKYHNKRSRQIASA